MNWPEICPADRKKLLELGRTMMVDAKIVFLDEVGAGVNRTLLKTIGQARSSVSMLSAATRSA